MHCSLLSRLSASALLHARVLTPVYHRCVPVSRAAGHCINLQQSRNVMVFRRMYPVAPYAPTKTGPFRPKLEPEQFVYILEDNSDVKPAGDMDVILATDVDGLGLSGDIVRISKVLARTHMLPVGVAEYASPTNIEKYAQIRKAREKEKRQTMSALRTVKELMAMTLPIPMSPSIDWQLNKTHVRVAFRTIGVELTDDCITLPEEPITEHKTVNIQITVNGLDRVNVKALIYPYNKTVPVSLPPVWAPSSETRFDIEQVIADAARRMRGMTLSTDSSAQAAAAS